MRLSYSSRAKRDLDRIIFAIANNNPATVAAFRRAIRIAGEQIKRFPEAAPVVDPTGLRCLALPRWGYQIFYSAGGDGGGTVVTIRSGRQRPLHQPLPDESIEE